MGEEQRFLDKIKKFPPYTHTHILDNLTFADRLRPRPLTIEETLSNFIPFQREPFIAVIHSLSTDSTPRLFDASITRSL